MYKSLQAGRAFAALIVVLYHLGKAIAADKYYGIEGFSIPFSFGDSGVEFFFVLSGFIILSAHRGDIFKPHKLKQYIMKRLIRIYPTYWMIFIPIFILAISSIELRDSVPHDFSIIMKSLLLIPQDKNVVGGTGAPVLGVAWTLQYEIIFYFLFSMLILNKWLSIGVGVAVLVLGVYASYIEDITESYLFEFLTKDYMLLFVMGMIASIAHKKNNISIKQSYCYIYSGAIFFILISLDKVMQLNFLIDWKILLYGFSSGLMIYGFVNAEDNGNAIGSHKWLQVLGDSSYALYLMHYPLISILCKFSLLLGMNEFGYLGAAVVYIIILCLCLVSAVVFHLYAEKPIIKYLRNSNRNNNIIYQN